MDKMEKLYRVVTMNGVKEYDMVAELIKEYTPVAVELGAHLREELQNEYILEGLLGPMYDGEKDGRPVVRYETEEVYNMLSR